MSRVAVTFDDPDEASGGGGEGRTGEADVPLTVAAVAARLGVAPSTLRTWDRRYGLGPSGRSAGSHRRYTPDDVARLETMRRLTLAGAAPSDAARVAAAGRVSSGLAPVPAPAVRARVDALSLAAAAVDGAEARLQGMLTLAVDADGVVGAWEEVARPAFGYLAERETGDRPGRDPEVLLAGSVLAVVRAVADAAEAAAREGQAERARVVMVAESADVAARLAAHVLAAAITERGPEVRVLAAEAATVGLVGRLLEPASSGAVCVVGESRRAEELARWASERGRPPLFLVGPRSPELWLPGVLHVRTLPGAVHEIAGAVSGGGGVSRVADGPA